MHSVAMVSRDSWDSNLKVAPVPLKLWRPWSTTAISDMEGIADLILHL